MNRRILVLAAILVSCPMLAAAADGTASETRTGWIACNACAAPRVEQGASNPPNRECAQKCIREGSAMVFYDEGTKSLLRVDNPEAAKGQESHRIELTGTVDTKAKTIHVVSIKVLEKYVAKCAMPPAEKK